MRLIAAFSVALAAAAAVPALAADPDCQLGVMAASIFGRSQHTPDGGAALSDTFNVNGRGAGLEVGCVAARDRWRYGFFGDLMKTNAKGTQQALPPNQFAFLQTSFDWIGTLRGVAGYQFDSGITAYLTGGVAASSVEMRVCGGSCFVSSQNMWGVVGGGGLQVRLLRHLSANLEYLYYRFEDKPFPSSGAVVIGDHDISVHPEAQVLRAGLRIHF